MQWSVHRPFVPAPLRNRMNRRLLRRQALRYAEHGWPVTPGAHLTGHRFVCGRPGCPIMMCHPALESWQDSATIDPRQINEWWRHQPHTVLLATGDRFDALEVPASLGLRVLGTTRLLGAAPHNGLSGARGPVAVTAAGRWMFLVRPGTPLRPELANRLDIVRHGQGSWIPAAPSRLLEGAVRWAVPPERTQWRLSEAELVQSLLTDALGSVRTRPPTVPRQLSTARRAG
jgi:hypothetical protein